MGKKIFKIFVRKGDLNHSDLIVKTDLLDEIRKGIKNFFVFHIFNMIKLSSILQVKAGKTKIKKSYKGST